MQSGTRLHSQAIGPNAVVVFGVGLAPAVHENSVAWLYRHPLFGNDVFQLPLVNGLIHRNVGLSAMPGHVQEHAARQNTVAPGVQTVRPQLAGAG